MHTKQKYQEALSQIAKRLTDIRVLGTDGRPGFAAGEYSLLISVLESAIDFPPEIPHDDRLNLLRTAVSEAAKEHAVTPELLGKHLRDAESQYLKQPLRDFVWVTALGIVGHHGLRRIQIRGNQISFLPAMPKRFDRGAIAERIADWVPNPCKNVTHVLVRVRARTANAAVEKAQTSLDLIRALWNFVMNFGSYDLIGFDSWKPINAILLGSVHTLHHRDGTLFGDTFWYERHSLNDKWVHAAGKSWPSVLKRANKLRRRLRSIAYGDDIEHMLVRYVRALDEADPRQSFGRLWGVLEYLVDSVGDYEKLIARVSFLSPDDERGLLRILLQHLRDVRNAVVHGDEERSRIRTYLHQVKLATDRLIMFHLRSGGRFGSRAAAAAFLDTPVDPKLLRERISDYRRVLHQKR